VLLRVLRVGYGLGCLQAWFHALDLYNLLESRGSGRSCSGLVGYVDEPYISLMLNLILLSLTHCRELRIPLSCSFVEFDGETFQEVITS
jgi:hypothetical protein